MKAIVVGATGLVGSNLMQQLVEDVHYEEIIVLTRRHIEIAHSKIREHIVDFSKPAEWRHLVKGDVLFSAMGSTIKKAGTKEAQFLIDYSYQYHCAKAAASNKVAQYVLVSAAYASADSKIFYSRMKGILERDVIKLPFEFISILKPGIISGDRKENRMAERISIYLFNLLHRLPGLRFTKPIDASTLATAMIKATKPPHSRVNIYQLEEVFQLAEKA